MARIMRHSAWEVSRLVRSSRPWAEAI
jgi:hypothetical protein